MAYVSDAKQKTIDITTNHFYLVFAVDEQLSCRLELMYSHKCVYVNYYKVTLNMDFKQDV